METTPSGIRPQGSAPDSVVIAISALGERLESYHRELARRMDVLQTTVDDLKRLEAQVACDSEKTRQAHALAQCHDTRIERIQESVSGANLLGKIALAVLTTALAGVGWYVTTTADRIRAIEAAQQVIQARIEDGRVFK